jgi:hypothetical protein
MKIPKGGLGKKLPYACKSVDVVQDILDITKMLNDEAKTLLIEGRVDELEVLKEKIETILETSGTFSNHQD